MIYKMCNAAVDIEVFIVKVMRGTSPADSCPRMCLSSTTIGPMRPACQKCTSELYKHAKVGVPCPDLQLDTYPQIPVLLISTITSPSAGVTPDWMSTTEGAASSIHRLCCGFVYTPMLGLIFKSEDIVVKRKDTNYAHSVQRAESRSS
jgi:hypothetical protein